ncbi:MAG: LeuA family protein, partial [Candidatus Sumerlaeota bacterium]
SSVHISLPASDIHLDALGKDRQWVQTRLRESVEHLRAYADFISVGAQDASRADKVFLVQLAREARRLGVHRFRLADTVGILTPASTRRLVKSVKRVAREMEVGFHAHNDLGMATANAFSALEVGARSVDVTVNGMGERAGNASLEALAMAGEVRKAFDFDLRNSTLQDLCELVATLSGRPITRNQPIVGKDVFRHESGIHCQALLADQATYEPFDPRKAGRSAGSAPPPWRMFWQAWG